MVPSDYLDGFIHYYLFNISCSGTGILKAICVYSKQLENTFRFIKKFFRNLIFFLPKDKMWFLNSVSLKLKKNQNKISFDIEPIWMTFIL